MVSAVNTKMVLGVGLSALYRSGMDRANKLKELRERAGLTQAELAEAIHSQQPRVADFERQPGEKNYRRIPLEKAKAAARVLRCPLWAIRPDILSADSIDLMLEGQSDAFKKEVRDYIIFKQSQQG